MTEDYLVKQTYLNSNEQYVLKKDITIPAGTVFDSGPIKVEYAVQPIEHVIGMGPDNCMYLMTPSDDLNQIPDWFEKVC